MKKRLLPTFIFLLCFSVISFSQPLSGAYTIGGVSPDYAGFSDAIAALNTEGVSGPVIFDIRDGVYNEQAILEEIVGASAVNTITFQSESGDSSAVVMEFNSGFSNNYVLRLDGTDYLSLTGITFRSLNVSYANLVLMQLGCNNINVSNCAFLGDVNSGYLLSSENSTDENILVQNSYFLAGSRGISFVGITADREDGNIIINSVFENQTSQSIYLTYQNAPLIQNNTITSTISSSSGYCIYAVSCLDGISITGNNIYRNSGSYGMYLESCDATAGSEGLIANNFISIGGTSTAYGIYTWYCDYLNIYFNNVLIRSSHATSGRALYLVNGSNMNLVNNIGSNSGGGYSIYTTTTTNLATSDHNDFYSSGPMLAYRSGSIEDLPAWQLASGLDGNSVSVNPLFAADDDLHVNHAFLDGTGASGLGIGVDFDGDTRGTPPDIGADEFTSIGDNAGLLNLYYPAAPFASGTYPISADFRNSGINTMTSLTIQWEVNGVAQPDVNWTGSLATGVSENIMLGNVLFNPLVRYDIMAWVTLPNGNADIDPTDDSLHVENIYTTIGGPYTIGGISPDFPNFSEAADAMNYGGLHAAVTFSVRDGIYNEQFQLGQVFNNDITNTISFLSESGDSSLVILEFNSPFSSNYLVQLNGTDYVSFSDMTFRTLNTSYADGIVFSGGCQDVSVANCAFLGDVNSGNLISSANSTDHGFIVTNSYFFQGARAIYLQSSSGNPENGADIDNCVFENQTSQAIYLTYQNAPTINNNIITSAAASSSGYSIYCAACSDGVEITYNYIYRNSGSYGMYLESCDATPGNEGLVYNNIISIGGTSTSYGIYTWYCDYLNIYFNNLLIRSSHATNGRALYIVNGSNIDLRNNVAANTGGGYAIYATTSSGLAISDYNDFYTSGGVVGFWSGSTQNSLADWQAASGLDVNSVSANPLFLADNDLHVNQAQLDAAGITIPLISDDFEGDPRGTPPDIGADEFTPTGDNAGLTSIAFPSAPFNAGSYPIQADILNSGFSDLTSVTIQWEINGVAQPDVNWTGVVSTGNSETVSLGNFTFNELIRHDIQAWVTAPNGNMDIDASDDTTHVFNIYTTHGGNYTIGGLTPDFPNFSEAADAMNFGGLNAAISFDVRDGTYNEQFQLGQVINNSAINTISYQSESGDSSAVILEFNSAFSDNYLIYLNGTDNVSIHQITFQPLNTNYANAILFENGSNNISITNCAFYGDINSGYLISSGTSTDENTIITNNYFSLGSRAIFLQGNSTTRENGTLIENNIIEDQVNIMVYLTNQIAPVIRNNIITSSLASSSSYSVYCSSCINGLEISENEIYRMSGSYGMYLESCDSSPGMEGVVSNNFVSIGGTSTSNAIFTWYCDYLNIYHNSFLSRSTHVSNGRTSYIVNGSNINLVNNIISNTGGGYAIYTTTTTNLAISDYNDLFATGANLGFYNSVVQPSLTDWQTATGDDANSLSVDPLFVSDQDLHTNNITLAAGTPLASVPTDIDGEFRSPVTPYIGADESVTANPDAGLISFDAPVIPFPSGVNDIYVTVVNNFATDLTSLTFSWEVNGVPEPDFNWTGAIASGNTSSVNIGSYLFDVGTPYDIEVIISSPNGMVDNIPQNDTIAVNDLYAALSGTYTIGAASPDFLNFTEARDALVNGGVVGPVILNVLDGTYTEQIEFGQILGASATNTVTFQSDSGNSALVTMENTSGSSNNYLVRLTGTDFIRFHNITFDALHPTYHRVFLLEGELVDIQLTGNMFMGAGTTYELIYGSSLNISNFEFIQNSFENGSDGIWLNGSSAFANGGTVIDGNTFANQRDNAVYLNYHTAPIVTGNAVSATGDNGYGGIYLVNCDGQLQATGNTIIAGLANYGIYVNSSVATAGINSLIANNFISVGGTGTTYGIWCVNSNYQDFYHNSVNVTNANATTSYAFYLNGGTVIDLVDNILANTGGGFCIYIQTTTALATSNYNNFYTTGATIGYWLGNRSSLVSWQGASGKDANSLNLDPLFASSTDLHISQVGLDGAGTPIPSVATDIDGDPRDPVNPDIGADEFSNFTDDIGVTAITSPASGCELTMSETVTITIQNYGSTAQTGFNVAFDVDGTVITENVGALNVAPGLTAMYTFAAGADLSVVGNHNIFAWTELPGDQAIFNDTSATLMIEHLSSPTASVSPPSATVCGGETVLLTASGGLTYLWSTGATTAIVSAAPLTTTVYSVTATNAQGCTDVASSTITTVGNVPTFSFTGNPNFVASGVNPLVASPYDQFNFEIDYFDADGDLPASSYPRLNLDYNSNGTLLDGLDRVYIMTEADATDTDPTDGKKYIFSVTGLALSTNYTLSFTANDASGCSGSFVSGNHPDVIDAADISIFANDITFSDPNPDPSTSLTIFATVHNYSGFSVNNFDVRLINQNTGTIYPDILVTSLPPGSSSTVNWVITTPPDPSWNPMEVIIDANNVLIEPNELDNQAIRPFINGDYILPGGIDVQATVNPVNSLSGTSSINITGHADYFGTALPVDPDVSGATVSFTITQTGQSFSTYTNSNGDFTKTFSPLTPGTYTVEGEITDFTLTGYFTRQFTILPGPCNPDLTCNVILDAQYNGGAYIIQLGSSVSGRAIVTNNGCASSPTSTLAQIISPVGVPVPGPFVVPPLSPGQSVVFEFTPTLTYNVLGTTYIRSEVDNGNLVFESNEGNNSCQKTIIVLGLPDITPAFSSKLPAQLFECTSGINFRVDNIGGLSTGQFEVELDIVQGASSMTITDTIANLNALSYVYLNYPNPFPFGTGLYHYTIRTDIPLPNGIVVEGNESNNVRLDSVLAVPCLPDLAGYGVCNPITVTPVDPAIPGNIQITAQMRNYGNAIANAPFDVNFTVSGPGIVTSTVTETYLSPVPVGGQFSVSTTIQTPMYGDNLIAITIDPTNVVQELNEGNNNFSDNLCWEFSLGSCGGGFWSHTYSVGQSTILGVGIYNSGVYAASDVEVDFEIQGPGLPPGWTNLGRASRNIPGPHCSCPFTLSLPNAFTWLGEGTYTVRMTVDADNDYIECNEANNQLIVQVNVANPNPDLRILSQFIAPSLLNPDVGENVTINLTYENIGAANIGDSFDIQCLVDDVQLGNLIPGMGLLSNDFTTVQATSPWSSNLPGIHIIRGIVDVGNVITETNELNNEASRAIIVGESPNLYFSSYMVSNPNPIFGDQILIQAVIPNEGDLDCNSDVLFSYVNDFGDTLLIDQTNITVAAGDSATVIFNWIVSDPSTTIVLEIVNADPFEFRIDDNILFIELGRLQLSTSTSPESCIGYADGQAVVQVTSGTPPYFFLWSEGTQNDTLYNALSGTYTVTVTDSDGADAVAGVIVGVLPDNEDPLIIGIPSDTTILVTGGNCPVPYTWVAPMASDNCGVVSFTSNFNPGDGFPPGLNMVTYTANDAAGNSLSLSFNVNVIGSPLAFAGPDQNVPGTTATLAALPADFGTGMWTVVTGTGILNDPFDAASDVSNLNPGLNTFAWTISNGTCPSSSDTVNITSTLAAQFNLKLYLQGPYLFNDTMSMDLVLPAMQPYGGPPWNYAGTESIAGMPPDITDWILITLRTDLSNTTTFDTLAALLRNDGQVLDPGGGNLFIDLSGGGTDSVFVCVYHRNHVGVMTPQKLGPGMGFVYTHDFSASAANSFGGASAVNMVAPGVFGMIGGDQDQNGQIQNSDLNNALLLIGLGGYLVEDFDLNGQIQNSDIQNFLVPNIGKGASFSY